MDDLFVPIAMFAMVVLIVYFVGARRHQERMELIKQGINPASTKVPTLGTGSLLWGLLIAAVGLGMVITFIAGHGGNATFGFGLVGLLGGVALLLYYRLTKAQRERAMKLYEQLITSQPTQLKPQEKVESEATPEA